MEIAYCQGMNFICYFLTEAGFDEEETFWMLCYIFEVIMPSGLIALLDDITFGHVADLHDINQSFNFVDIEMVGEKDLMDH